jgi:hypothetical protein
MEAGQNIQKYVQDLANKSTDNIHKRLINSYQGDNAKQSLEMELGRILEEVINRED